MPSGFQCLEVDLKHPLSINDWKHWYNIVKEMNGLGYAQILPCGQKSNIPLTQNVMHIVPGNSPTLKSTGGTFPIQKMIETEHNFVVSEYNSAMDEAAKESSSKKNVSQDIANKRSDFHNSRILKIDEYKFPHCVHVFDSVLNENSIKLAYNKCFQHLNLEQTPTVGITILLHTDWIFIAALSQAYTEVKGHPLFVDGLSYAGIFNVEILEKFWP